MFLGSRGRGKRQERGGGFGISGKASPVGDVWGQGSGRQGGLRGVWGSGSRRVGETDRDRQGQILGSKTDLKGIGAEHCDWPLMGV